MSITLQGQSRERVSVAGDIVTTLRVPVGWADRRFRIAKSDGTLLLGTYNEGSYRVAVEVGGAAIMRVRDTGRERRGAGDHRSACAAAGS